MLEEKEFSVVGKSNPHPMLLDTVTYVSVSKNGSHAKVQIALSFNPVFDVFFNGQGSISVVKEDGSVFEGTVDLFLDEKESIPLSSKTFQAATQLIDLYFTCEEARDAIKNGIKFSLPIVTANLKEDVYSDA